MDRVQQLLRKFEAEDILREVSYREDRLLEHLKGHLFIPVSGLDPYGLRYPHRKVSIAGALNVQWLELDP